MYCGKCGKEAAPGNRFCCKCSAVLQQQVQQPILNQPQPAAVRQTPPQALPVSGIYSAAAKPIKRGKRKALVAILCSAAALVIIAVVLLFVLPGLNGGINGEKIKEGMIEAEGIVVKSDIPDGTAALVVEPVDDDAFEGNAVSAAAVINYSEEVHIPVTLSLPMYKNDGGLYMMAVGVELYGTGGEITTVYNYYDVVIEGDIATASFIPAAELADEIYFASGTDTGLRPPWIRTRAVILSKTRMVATSKDTLTHFLLTYPRFFYGKDYFTSDQLIALFNIFEENFDSYQLDYLYQYNKRTSYPLDIYIESGLGSDGCFRRGANINYATITLNSNIFGANNVWKFNPTTGGDVTKVKSVFAHEFFHFVQANYYNPYANCEWFGEATASYFESLHYDGRLDQIHDVNDNWKKLYDGIFPPSDTADHGYGRMPLIEFLVNKLDGDPEFIRNVYNTDSPLTLAGWRDVIIDKTGLSPVDYAEEFYCALLLKEIKSYVEPSALYWNTFSKTPPKGVIETDVSGVCSLLNVKIPDFAKVQATLEQKGELKLADTTVTVPAFGARLVALDMLANSTALEKYPKELMLAAKAGTGCSVQLLEINTNNETTVILSDATAVDLKNKVGHGYLYMALVISLSDSAQDYKLQVYAQTKETQEYVWGLVEINPYHMEDFNETELLGEEFSISASATSCSIWMKEDMLGKITEMSATYSMPRYLEVGKPYQPSIPVSHSNFKFYVLFDGALDMRVNDSKTAIEYNHPNGLTAPGEPVLNAAGTGATGQFGSDTHKIVVGIFYDNIKQGAEYVYEWMPIKQVDSYAP